MAVLEDPGAAALVEGIVAHSPYLTREMLREQPFVVDILAGAVDAAIGRVWTDFTAIDPADGADAVMKALRVAKRRAAIVIALADLAGDWHLIQVTGAISEPAERGLAVSWRHALLEQIRRGKQIGRAHV